MNKEQILLDALNEAGNFTTVNQEFNEDQLGVIYRVMDVVKNLTIPLVINCANCKHYEVSKYVEPCYGCNDNSNHQFKIGIV